MTDAPNGAPQGERITIQNGHLQVPDQPIIPYVEGDGTGPDIWRASVRVFDAAVERAYGGKRKLMWHERSTRLATGCLTKPLLTSTNIWWASRDHSPRQWAAAFAR